MCSKDGNLRRIRVLEQKQKKLARAGKSLSDAELKELHNRKLDAGKVR